jgi:two-component system, sensor histidine kinase
VKPRFFDLNNRATPSSALLVDRREIHSLHFTINQAIQNSYSVWILALFIVASAWQQLPFWLAASWVVAVGAAFSLRTQFLSPGRQLTQVEAMPVFWRSRLNVSTAACGIIVSVGPLLFFPLISDTAQMYMSMIFCGWLAGAMSSLGARPRLYAGYASIFALGVTTGWFRVQSDSRYEVFLMLLLFVAITSAFARSFGAQVNKSIEIRFENEQLVESLKVARVAAEESSAAKSRFLAVASHDLRQPLHAVSLLNGLMARPQSPEKITEISRQMTKALSALERLFNSVLDFSKIEADKIKPELAWVSVSALFGMLHTSYAAQAQAKGLEFNMTVSPMQVRTDADLLERILRNLLENAFKFTVNGRVSLDARVSENQLVIAVTDTGPGIAHNLRAEIFKEYYQGGDKTANGLGLGLAIVRRLCDILGFRVEVADAGHQGSQFNLLIDMNMVRSAQDALAEPVLESHQSAISGMFVAYVDDDAASREALALLLEDWGCRFVGAASLEDLLKVLTANDPPDALLTDLSLANGNTGLEVIAAVRLQFGAVSAAILTGDILALDAHTMGELEYPVLRKPVPARELHDLLEVFRNIA